MYSEDEDAAGESAVGEFHSFEVRRYGFMASVSMFNAVLKLRFQ